MVRVEDITYNWKNVRQQKLFEDFFDDSDAQDAISDNSIDNDSEEYFEGKTLRIHLMFRNMLEPKNCNIAKIFKKMNLILENSLLFKNIRCKNIRFYDNKHPESNQEFDIRNLPNTPDYIYNITKYEVFPNSGLNFYFDYIPGKKIIFKKFCDEIYKMMKLVADNSVYHPDSKGEFLFDINPELNEDCETYVAFGFFIFPMQNELKLLYNEFYSESVDDSDESTVHSSVKDKTKLKECVEHGLEKINRKVDGMKFHLMSIDDCSEDYNIKFVKLRLVDDVETTMDVMRIYNNLKLYVLDSIPTHYFMIMRVCLVVYFPDNYEVMGLGNKLINKKLMDHSRNLLKAAEMLPVKLNRDGKLFTTARFIQVSYSRCSSAVAYMCVPNKRGNIAPDLCRSGNVSINKMLDTRLV